MAILLPLSLIGLGACIYYLFVAATLALPILIGSAVGMAVHAAGSTVPSSLLLGVAAFLLAITLGRFAALTLRSPLGRGTVMLLFACPATLVGFFISGAMARFAGGSGFVMPFALCGALFCGAVAAGRVVQRGN